MCWEPGPVEDKHGEASLPTLVQPFAAAAESCPATFAVTRATNHRSPPDGVAGSRKGCKPSPPEARMLVKNK